VVIAALVAGLLVVSAIAAYQFVRFDRAARDIGEAGPPRPEEGSDEGGGGLDDLLSDLFEDLFGGGGFPGGRPDLLACLGGEDLFGGEPAPPPTGGLEQQVRDLARQVEDIRQLTFGEQVEPRLLPSGQTADRVQDLFLEDYTAEVADTESRILEALGAVPPGTDLRQTRARTLGSQVVGFYVPETGELVVEAEGGELGTVDRITLAHELEHALADQNLDLPIPLQPKPGREDRDLAGMAVIEGDATLTMQRYAFTLSFEEQFELSDPALQAEAEAGLAGLPHYLRQELLFPYESGLSFVCDLYAEGGWEAVNDAYRDPPTTSAQILFPDRYTAGEEAVDPPDPGDPGRGWQLEGRHELGAANLLWLFEAPGGRRSGALDGARTGASAWAGGEVHLWQRGPDTALGVSLAEREGLDVLCSAMSHWYAVAFPNVEESGSALDGGLELDGARQDAVLQCTDDEVHLGIAPDLATAGRLA
jgi:hypothetical protein